MRFQLIDRIESVEAGRSLRAAKLLTNGEEYLRDHFPGFPVMPGVLMLQALTEACAWLWRTTTDYAHSVIVLRESKGVKYGSLLKPGHLLELEVEMTASEADTAVFKGKGFSDGNQTVTGKLSLTGYNLEGKRAGGAAIDAELASFWRRRYEWLSQNMSGRAV